MSVEKRAWILDHWELFQREISYHREHRQHMTLPYKEIEVIKRESDDVAPE